jgi:hypothetical protein
MIRYSWRSTNLDEIAKELYDLGIEVKINKERELLSSGEIREERYLKVTGDNVVGRLYPTWASLYLYGELKTEKDDKLIEYVKKRYKHTTSREDIGFIVAIAVAVSFSAILSLLLSYLYTK